MFWREILLARVVTIFPKNKKKDFNILLKMHKNNTKSYQGSKLLNKVDKFARIQS